MPSIIRMHTTLTHPLINKQTNRDHVVGAVPWHNGVQAPALWCVCLHDVCVNVCMQYAYFVCMLPKVNPKTPYIQKTHTKTGQFFEHVVLRQARPPLSPEMPPDYRLLITACWASEPEQRPTAPQVMMSAVLCAFYCSLCVRTVLHK